MNLGPSFEGAGLKLTEHAAERLFSRRINRNGIETALVFGREVHSKGITFYVVGRREVVRARRIGIDISRVEGIHVLCGRDGAVVTTYRNRDLRGIRPGRIRFPRRQQYAGRI